MQATQFEASSSFVKLESVCLCETFFFFKSWDNLISKINKTGGIRFKRFAVFFFKYFSLQHWDIVATMISQLVSRYSNFRQV